ncbi:hypothetical protein E2K98_15070 [Bacillus salipaludis]|uniref:Serine protease n=1 Tax=Bacillus salipaludis TaxID=2547811 RepID=A0A4R5VRB1_9BACI|nr:hypothetical protein [Bacillus salipaludis]MDQ6598416.1 hypothetical protein [Bacillus salipaludis]TDK61024.1 hypothetical protein E2K98_15070 [Bacillus salipaludis]
MAQKSIDNSNEIRNLMENVVALEEQIQHLTKRIQTIQLHCKHVFLETAFMRKCRKCSFTESTYY